MNFKRTDIEKADAIVSVFETGKPHGDYAAVAVLNDGAGLSYGIKQFTHRSGSLLAVIEKYLATGAKSGRETIAYCLPVLRRKSKAAISELAADMELKKALKVAAATPEMRKAQDEVAYERYIKPAVEECERLGFGLPLSLAVVCDSMVHGSWESLRDQTGRTPKGVTLTEKQWITSYVRLRHMWLRSVPRLKVTSYRTRFFLNQIMIGHWELQLPMEVHGVLLKDQPPAISSLPQPHQTGRDQGVAAPASEQAKVLDEIEASVNEIAAKVDQVDRIVETAVTRTDKAKSLWTTIAGTTWQIAWAVGGFLAGVPREVWLVVAVIAGALMLLFLYRQIALGKIREGSEFQL